MRTLTLTRKTVTSVDAPVTLRVVTHSGAQGLLRAGEELALSIRDQGEAVSLFLPDGSAPGGESRIDVPAGRDPVRQLVCLLATAKGELECVTWPLPEEEEAPAAFAPAPVPQGPGELTRYRLGGEGWADPRQHQSGRRGEQLCNLATGTASLVLTILTRPESSPQKEMRNRGCHTLAVKMVFHFEDMDLLYYFDGSQEPGDSWRRYYRYMVCGPREEPLFLDGWEMKWVENAAHTHLVKLLEEQGLLEKAWMEEGRVGLRP